MREVLANPEGARLAGQWTSPAVLRAALDRWLADDNTTFSIRSAATECPMSRRSRASRPRYSFSRSLLNRVQYAHPVQMGLSWIERLLVTKFE